MKKASSGTSRSFDRLVVDANVILSGLLKGASLRVFWSFQIAEFATIQVTLEEVHSYIPELAHKAQLAEEILLLDLAYLPLRVYAESFYQPHLHLAEQRMGKRDPKDVHLLALALRLKAPIWSNDKDFTVAGVQYYPTAVLLKMLNV